MNPIRRSLSLLLPLLALLVASASAQAAVRYASPTGAGDCSEGNPCSLKVAYDSATGPSSVILEPGTYGTPLSPILNLGTEPGSPLGMNLSAKSADQRPTIYASSTSGHFDALSANSGAIYDMNIVVVAGAETYYGLRADLLSRVHVTGNAINGACFGKDTIVNSVCATSADYGAGIAAAEGGSGSTIFKNYTYTNVTAWGSGAHGYGISLDAGNSYALTANVRNSIVHGALRDVYASSTGIGGSSSDVVLANSNFATGDTSGASASFTSPATSANQSAPPQLTNPAADSFTEKQTSPTIDAGDDAVIDGFADVFGAARIQGPHVDIGAHETSLDPPIVPGPAGPTAPTLGKLKLSKKKFTAASKGAGIQPAANAKKKANKGLGATVTVTSSGPGSIYFTLFKSTKKQGRTVLKQVKGFEKLTLATGTNKFWFSGRWNKKKLSPGKYQLRGTPTPTGGSITNPKGDEPGTSKGQTSSVVKK